jgi:hypothetical protein
MPGIAGLGCTWIEGIPFAAIVVINKNRKRGNSGIESYTVGKIYDQLLDCCITSAAFVLCGNYVMEPATSGCSKPFRNTSGARDSK